MALLSGGEFRLPLLRVSGGVHGADRYSKQQVRVCSLPKGRTLVYGRASGTGRSPKLVPKIVGFRLWCAPDKGREQKYIKQYWVVLNVQRKS